MCWISIIIVIVSQCRHSPVSFSWTAWDPELCYWSCSSLAQALGRRVDVFSDSKLFFAMTSCVLLEQILDSYSSHSSHSSHSSRTLLFFADGIASRIGWNIILASKDSLSKPASYKQQYITIVLAFHGIHSVSTHCSALFCPITSRPCGKCEPFTDVAQRLGALDFDVPLVSTESPVSCKKYIYIDIQI